MTSELAIVIRYLLLAGAVMAVVAWSSYRWACYWLPLWDALDAAIGHEPRETRWTVYNPQGLRIGRAYRSPSGDVQVKLF